VPVGAVFVGDGARRHRAAIEGAGFPVAPDEARASIAVGLLACLAQGLGGERMVDASAWEPAYVRPWSPEPSWTT
jgi:hypothetical protein